MPKKVPGVLYATGLTSTVILGRHRQTNQAVAVKSIEKGKLTNAQEIQHARDEVEIHRRLKHPCILPLLTAEETEESFLLVFPYASGGDLHEATKFNTIRETDCRNLADQLLHGLVYLHEQGILHGDMKPHNVLLVRYGDRHAAQLCDFGLAAKVECSTGLLGYTGLRGTSGYFSPEMIQQQSYGFAIDLWVVGLMMFKLLGGYEPFYPPTRFDNGVEFEPRYWSHITEESVSLISSLLSLQPNDRPSAQEALGHQFFKMDIQDHKPNGSPAPMVLPFFAYNDLPCDVLWVPAAEAGIAPMEEG